MYVGALQEHANTALLCDLAELNSETYSPKEAWNVVNYIDTSALTLNDLTEIQRINPSEEKLPTRARRKVASGDILYSTVRPNQNHYGLLYNPEPRTLASTAFAVIRPSDTALSPLIYLALTDEGITKSLQQVAETSTSTIPSIRPVDLEQIAVVVPADEYGNELVAQIEAAFKQIDCNKRESLELAALRDVLLPKLMSGEIDVSNADLTLLNSHLVQNYSSYSKLLLIVRKGTVMEIAINNILKEMQTVLDPYQLKHLAKTLKDALKPREPKNDLLELFLTAKHVEGCSSKTLEYYQNTLLRMIHSVNKPYTLINSNDLREYLNNYELTRNSSKITIDNIRRIMSSFFAWLEDEDYIVKSPVRRIHKVKTVQIAKETFTDEEIETLRSACSTKRDLAIIDLLISTGMRIGELVRLNINDINLQERECIVLGKGNKQRPVYFDARTKQHLCEYLKTRTDNNPALFIRLNTKAKRISIGGIEMRLRKIGKVAGINRVHPHKFRRTLATHAIDKGMPIEQVQKLLGHAKIDTTMHYAMVNQNNVKASHRRYLE